MLIGEHTEAKGYLHLTTIATKPPRHAPHRCTWIEALGSNPCAVCYSVWVHYHSLEKKLFIKSGRHIILYLNIWKSLGIMINKLLRIYECHVHRSSTLCGMLFGPQRPLISQDAGWNAGEMSTEDAGAQCCGADIKKMCWETLPGSRGGIGRPDRWENKSKGHRGVCWVGIMLPGCPI